MVAFGVGDAVDGYAGGEDYLFDPQFAGCFYYGVGAECVDAEGFVVGDAVWLRDTFGLLDHADMWTAQLLRFRTLFPSMVWVRGAMSPVSSRVRSAISGNPKTDVPARCITASGVRISSRKGSLIWKWQLKALKACAPSVRSAFNVCTFGLSSGVWSTFSTSWPYESSFSMTQRPTTPEPPVTTMRFLGFDVLSVDMVMAGGILKWYKGLSMGLVPSWCLYTDVG